jgi:hypothetical protein
MNNVVRAGLCCVCVYVSACARAACLCVSEEDMCPSQHKHEKPLRLNCLFTCLVNAVCMCVFVSESVSVSVLVSVSVSWGQTLDLYKTGIKNPSC